MVYMFSKKIKAVVVFLLSTIAILAHADFPGDILYSVNNQFERASTKLQACQNVASSWNLRKFLKATDWVVSEYEGGRCCTYSAAANHNWCADTFKFVICPENSSMQSFQLATCRCNSGYLEQGNACERIIYRVEINGVASTNALPSMVGPISQKLIVTRNGDPFSMMPVSIKLTDTQTKVIVNTSGTSDENGEFAIDYIPPYFRTANIDVEARCRDCSNVATKTITVIGNEVDLIDQPQMCHR